MKALLLGGYRTSQNCEQPLGLEKGADGQRGLDSHIQQLTRLGLEVVTVLAGEHADEQLRLCSRVANTELVFDTSNQVSLATNLKSGLAATEGEGCFALPLEVPVPPETLWLALRGALKNSGFKSPSSILQAVDAQGAPWHLGFPLLVTRQGNAQIRNLANFRSLTDPRLAYEHIVYPPDAGLAARAKAL